MDRTRFFKKEIVEGVEEFDFLQNNLSKFTMNQQPIYYRLTSIDRKRPDLISYRNYGRVGYWWVVCLASGIEDPFFDTQVGVVATIPSIVDIQNFVKKYKLR